VVTRLSRGARVLVVALAAHAAIAGVTAARSGRPAADFDRYWEIASAAGRPYRDYPVEHPIGTLLVFKSLAAIGGGRGGFGLAVVLVNFLADLAIVAGLLIGWDATAAAAFAVIVLPILELLFNRIDLWSMAAATVAMAAWRRDRDLLSGAALAMGVGLKLWPLGFVGLLLVPRRGRRRFAAAGAFGAAALSLGMVWWCLAGWTGLYQVLTFRAARGWQIESTVGSALHLAGVQPVRFESGSWRIGAVTGLTSVLLMAVAMPALTWSVWRGATRDRVGAGWLAGTATLLLLSTLLSAQFIGWLVPGAAIAWYERNRPAAVVTTVAVCLTGVFMTLYGKVVAGAVFFLALVVVRNVVLAAIVVITTTTLVQCRKSISSAIRRRDVL